MIKFVKTLSSEILEGFRRIKVQRLGKSDIQTAYQVNPHGVDSNPIAKLKAIHVQTGEKGETAIIGYINKELAAEAGEIRIFSTDDDGVLQAYLFAKKDGNLEVNGDADNLARYSKLEEAHNDLKDEVNAMIDEWNLFANAYVPGSPTVTGLPPTASPVASAAADISAAKIDNVKTN